MSLHAFTYSFIDNKFKQTESEFKTPLLTISDQQGGDSNWEKVRQEVTCAICLELLDDLKSMPCLHTYCKKCLMEALAKRPHDPDLPRDRPAINCPLCRTEVALSDQGIEALPSNFSATRLVETVQLQDKLEQNKTPLCDGCKESDAVASCCDCRGFFLCASCLKAHKNIPTTKKSYFDDTERFINTQKLCCVLQNFAPLPKAPRRAVETLLPRL